MVTRTALVVVVTLLGVLLLLFAIGFLFDIKLLTLLEILAVPITVGVAVPLLNWLQKRRELEVENQRAQDEAFQAYLDQMSQLLTDKARPLHKAQRGDSLSTVARARTLTVLTRLDGERKRSVLQFLYEAELINVDLLSGLELKYEHQGVLDLSGAHLLGADLRKVRLRGAHLQAQPELSGVDLRGARLDGADLSGAEVYNRKQLAEAASLEGATMPDGRKYEDWLKDREDRKEDAENGGPS